MDTRTARRLLTRERERLQGLLQAATASGDAVSLASLGPGDNADVGGRILERELAESVQMHAEAGLREVDEAFARLERKRFGVCEVCREPIGRARLLERPASRTCVVHAGADTGAYAPIAQGSGGRSA